MRFAWDFEQWGKDRALEERTSGVPRDTAAALAAAEVELKRLLNGQERHYFTLGFEASMANHRPYPRPICFFQDKCRFHQLGGDRGVPCSEYNPPAAA